MRGAHQASLPAEQMGAAGDVQHQAVRRVQSDHGGETAEILKHPCQQGGVRFGSMGDSAQCGRARLGIGQGQAGREARSRCRRIDGSQPQPALDLLDQNDRRVFSRPVFLPLLTPQSVAGQPGEPDRQIAARGGGMFAAHDPTP